MVSTLVCLWCILFAGVEASNNAGLGIKAENLAQFISSSGPHSDLSSFKNLARRDAPAQGNYTGQSGKNGTNNTYIESAAPFPTSPMTPPSNATAFSFEDMLAALGSLSNAQAVLFLPWRPANISLAQSQFAIAAAMAKAGGFDVPCTAAVPLLVVPGFLMLSIPGVVYPTGFGVAVSTRCTAALARSSKPRVNAPERFCRTRAGHPHRNRAFARVTGGARPPIPRLRLHASESILRHPRAFCVIREHFASHPTAFCFSLCWETRHPPHNQPPSSNHHPRPVGIP